MTTRYRVEYALKTHRRDELIEWIKGLLAVPFVLHSQTTAIYDDAATHVQSQRMTSTTNRRYGEIMRDVEQLIDDHIKHQNAGTPHRSKLKLLVPSVGNFFTPLKLEAAFAYQDARRAISSRRFVPPSFNDIRLTLNTAQLMSLVQSERLGLVTFDGDLTLYDDGESLLGENPVIPRLLHLLRQDTYVGIVTAAGYTDAQRYYGRLHGLLDAIEASDLPPRQKNNLIVLGGESNYLFRFDSRAPGLLAPVPRDEWALEDMKSWSEEDITELLDIAEGALTQSVRGMGLRAQILRKERAVGIVAADGQTLAREQLEETVLATQKTLEMSDVGGRLPFCAFNGGHDVFVDIGDKSWGVLSCQRFLSGILGKESLHVGDQFLSAGANDFKARLACTTAWIASPTETVRLLDELEEHRETFRKAVRGT
ncbi:MAG: IMP 5'-nucleotidase [Caeruleum heppii]|nr:MAG: IMP 5'-nucleotidase [Caeruleum heppii]